MKAINPDREYNQLLELVDRYFEGETSLAEEKQLRRMLAETDSDTAEIEEARAVMGIFATSRRQPASADTPAAGPRRRRRTFPLAAISAAASVVVIIVAVLSLLHPASMSEHELMASTSVSKYDSIARMRMEISQGGVHTHGLLAMATARLIKPESPDEVDALISSEMGLMAEAERSVYESIAEDFTLLRDAPLGIE